MITLAQVKAALEAANVPDGRQTQILAQLGVLPADPPLTEDDKRSILHFMSGKGIQRWSSWPAREKQARKELPSLFSAFDAFNEAEQALANELSNLDKSLS